ncbi:unnamed protein product [Lactuca saligna]|uniref:Uncharacterized protein n=1 Tax=Lactuca saligna TaxID=75948 RepID=A0AA35ZS42_LACSI|nr:unnamed protein product [Lactuca saligna]
MTTASISSEVTNNHILPFIPIVCIWRPFLPTIHASPLSLLNYLRRRPPPSSLDLSTPSYMLLSNVTILTYPKGKIHFMLRQTMLVLILDLVFPFVCSDGEVTSSTPTLDLNPTISNISQHLAPSGRISITIHPRSKTKEKRRQAKFRQRQGERRKSMVRPMQPLDGEQVSIQEEHASNCTPVSQTPSSSTAETAATYITSLWRPTINPSQQAAIVTATPQIVATQQTKIHVSQQQSFPHNSGT